MSEVISELKRSIDFGVVNSVKSMEESCYE